MGKRKREPYVAPSDQTPEYALHIQKLTLEKKFSHGAKRLNQVLKTAKGFERQKLGKRITLVTREAGDDASKADDKTGKLEREVVVLKALDIPSIADAHLRKSIGKLKGASTSPALPANLIRTNGAGSHDEGPDAIARNNVVARLLNVKLVKHELVQILKGISEVLGLEDGSKKTPSTVDALVNQDQEAVKEEIPETTMRDTAGDDDWEGIDSPEHVNDHEPHGDENGDAGDDDEEDDYRQYDDRLASSSDEDDDTIPIPSSHNSANPPKAIYDPADDFSLSLSPSPSLAPPPPLSPLPPPPAPSHKKPTSTQKPAPKNPNSTFLPSLTLGGYWSGSDSSPEKDSSLADVAPPRKNRRGQRARRQIWEQKFGQKANHVKQAARDQGWDARRGATADSSTKSARRPRGAGASHAGSSGGAGRATGANTIETKPRPHTSQTEKAKGKAELEKKPLHPSWAAAKKAKEQKKGAKFAGTKVVFS